jgi:anti-sigma B factor antagonist
MASDMLDQPVSARLSSGSPLEVTIGCEGEAVVLSARGVIDLLTVPTLSDCLQAAVQDVAGPVVVDLAEVSFLDSTGLNALIKAHNALAPQQSLSVRNATAIVAEVFAVTRTAELFGLPS